MNNVDGFVIKLKSSGYSELIDGVKSFVIENGFIVFYDEEGKIKKMFNKDDVLSVELEGD